MLTMNTADVPLPVTQSEFLSTTSVTGTATCKQISKGKVRRLKRSFIFIKVMKHLIVAQHINFSVPEIDSSYLLV